MEAIMRMPAFLSMTMLAATTVASAQSNFFYAERGHWTVMNSSTRCHAWNRPAADFNAAPYNGLQISAWPKSAISIDVFFWPGAVTIDREYQLQLYFSAGDVTLPAKPTIGDYVLASAPDIGLWKTLEKSKSLTVAVVGEPTLTTSFTLDGIDWVIDTLTTCSGFLPKE
jgi:hypothetical protein